MSDYLNRDDRNVRCREIYYYYPYLGCISKLWVNEIQMYRHDNLYRIWVVIQKIPSFLKNGEGGFVCNVSMETVIREDKNELAKKFQNRQR